MNRANWFRILLCVAVLGGTSGCIGAVDRADFENQIRTRGGGLVSALPRAAVAALAERIGAGDPDVNVILLTAPNSTQFRLVLNDQPTQVTNFLDSGDLTAREPTVRLRVRPPGQPRVLDEYSFTLGDLSSPRPVRVSALDDLDGENFTISEVPGLAHIEDIVDTARTRSEIPDGQVTAIIVSRFDRDIRMVANVVSARSEAVVEFDRTGAFLRVQQV
ncbi:hypothetical protein [Nocardia macrotermitis]|uniref:Uncharacterized protein n=1 Tax=Nocardia macrotermitis TaxID=2585198 RepID=A0A7K0CYE5_9NOCA|nr:hypothetical protein [Nocardia macrotermitis]MQY17972.1 hypothetical protein [Nocardia macrotermitis]